MWYIEWNDGTFETNNKTTAEVVMDWLERENIEFVVKYRA